MRETKVFKTLNQLNNCFAERLNQLIHCFEALDTPQTSDTSWQNRSNKSLIILLFVLDTQVLKCINLIKT